MECEYCDWIEDDAFGVAPYLLHLYMEHEKKFIKRKIIRKLPKYEHRQVFRITLDQLDKLKKLSKNYPDRKATRTGCKTCSKDFKVGQVVVTGNSYTRSLRHLSCAKRVLYV